jgi:hypothetical protein
MALGQSPGSLQVFDPAHQKPVTYSDDKISASLAVGKLSDSLEIRFRDTEELIRLSLPAELAQVDQITRGSSNKLVVRGMLNGSASQIVVIDLVSRSISDKFSCYLPMISPNADYVAFIKFYPTHFAEGIEDRYMIYDLRRDAAYNRPPGTRRGNWQLVGQCVYPVGCRNAEYDNLNRPVGTRHLSKSGFFWNADSSSYVFADRIESSPSVSLVLVSVAGDAVYRVKSLEISSHDLCSGRQDDAESCPVIARNISFSEDGSSIVVTWQLVESDETRLVRYTLSSFR